MPACGLQDHDLWQRDGVEGRFYTVVDLLIDPPLGSNRGWVLELAEDDRVITQAFALVSVLVFTTFQPFDADPFDDDGNASGHCCRHVPGGLEGQMNGEPKCGS